MTRRAVRPEQLPERTARLFGSADAWPPGRSARRGIAAGIKRRTAATEKLPRRFLLPFEGRDVKIEHSLKPAEGKA